MVSIPIKIIGIKSVGIIMRGHVCSVGLQRWTVVVSGRCFDENFHKGTVWPAGSH